MYLMENPKKYALSKKEQRKTVEKTRENSNFVKNFGPLVCTTCSASFSTLYHHIELSIKLMVY